MMDEPKGHTVWHEPLVGALFGNFYYVRAAHRQGGRNAILGKPKGLRRKLIRSFVLQAAEAKFPRAKEREYLIVKEPNGSLGAPLISAALPESRMIFLVRDPRDVAFSPFLATRKMVGSAQLTRRANAKGVLLQRTPMK